MFSFYSGYQILLFINVVSNQKLNQRYYRLMPGLYFNKRKNDKRMGITYTHRESEREGELSYLYNKYICKREMMVPAPSCRLLHQKYIYFIIIFDAVHLLLRKKVVLKSGDNIICPCIYSNIILASIQIYKFFYRSTQTKPTIL